MEGKKRYKLETYLHYSIEGKEQLLSSNSCVNYQVNTNGSKYRSTLHFKTCIQYKILLIKKLPEIILYSHILNFREISFTAVNKNTKNYIPANSTYTAIPKLFTYQRSDKKIHLSIFKYQRDTLPFFVIRYVYYTALYIVNTQSTGDSCHQSLLPPPQNSGIK